MVSILIQTLFVSFLALFSFTGCEKKAQQAGKLVGTTFAGGAYGAVAGTVGIVGQKTILKKVEKPEGTPTAVVAACLGSTLAGAATGGPLGMVMGAFGGMFIAHDIARNQRRKHRKRIIIRVAANQYPADTGLVSI